MLDKQSAVLPLYSLPGLPQLKPSPKLNSCSRGGRGRNENCFHINSHISHFSTWLPVSETIHERILTTPMSASSIMTRKHLVILLSDHMAQALQIITVSAIKTLISGIIGQSLMKPKNFTESYHHSCAKNSDNTRHIVEWLWVGRQSLFCNSTWKCDISAYLISTKPSIPKIQG